MLPSQVFLVTLREPTSGPARERPLPTADEVRRVLHSHFGMTHCPNVFQLSHIHDVREGKLTVTVQTTEGGSVTLLSPDANPKLPA